MIKINDYVYQLENEVIEYVKDQVYHESFTYYSDSEIKEFQENAVNSRICDLEEILDVDKVLKMNEKIKLERANSTMDGVRALFDRSEKSLKLEYEALESRIKKGVDEENRMAYLKRMSNIHNELKCKREYKKIEKADDVKMTKTYFTIKEAVETIIEAIEEERTEYIEDLHNVTFNEDYYIIGTNAAKEALEQYGVFNAIEEIQQYEKDNFGEILTDLSEPERVANMLWYITGDNVLQDVSHYDYDLTEKEDQKTLIKELKEYASKFE